MSFFRQFSFVAAIVVRCASVEAVDDPQWKVPPGFTIELVAGPELVQHPTMGGFDDQGRLYICDGPGANLPAKELYEQLPHSIKRLEDTDGDGRFDKSTVFADKMTFPNGAVWHDGYVYTASPPNIWRLYDADDDGVADDRKVLVSEFGSTGNAADIHGCFLGPEGRLWWCDGRHGHNLLDKDGNTISKGLAARLFSCKLDGSDVESFAGGGMDNPVEVAVTDEGEPLGTVAIYDNKPDRMDAIIHWVYGGVYPHSEKVLGEFKRTGPLLPPVSRFGRVAPAGIARYRSPEWGPEFQGNLFHAQFNTHRVIRTKLTRDGATFKSTDEDFLVAENPDVHVTDVIEDADGSLLVVDTGGWFLIACPNSQIAKPEVLGGIYRIRKTQFAQVDDARGLQLPWKEIRSSDMATRLRDHRPAVRDRAVATLALRGRKYSDDVVKALRDVMRDDRSETARLGAIWTAARVPTGAELLYDALDDESPRIRLAAVTALGSRRDGWSFGRYVALLDDPDFAVRRAAATALGRAQAKQCVSDLRAALPASVNDRFFEHALIDALIEIDDAVTMLEALNDSNPAVCRGALLALDQTQNPELTRDAVAKLLDSGDLRLQRAALEVMQKHADWGDAVLGYLTQSLRAPTWSETENEMLRDTILAYRRNEQVRQLVTSSLAAGETSPAKCRLLLEVIERSEFDAKSLPPSWAEQIRRRLDDPDDAVVRQAILAASRIGGATLDGALSKFAADATRLEPQRLAALSALGTRVSPLDAGTFQLLANQLTTAVDPLDRLSVAAVLGSAPLDVTQRSDLIAAIANAGPLELPPLLNVYQRESSPEEGRSLLAALASSPGLENVSSSVLEKIVSQYPPELRSSAKPLFKRINADIETQRARLTELLPQLDGGDVKRGSIVFQMQKTGCISCHRVRDRGASIGPDLTKVGQIRSRADILEAVLYPSASFVRNFESVQVLTTDGLTVTGILARETPEAVYLRTAQKVEVRVPRVEIEAIAPSKLSIMPQGLDKAMTLEELRNLVAYLQSLK